MKFILATQNNAEYDEMVELVKRFDPDIIKQETISGNGEFLERDGTYTVTPFNYTEWVLDIQKSSEIVYLAQHVFKRKVEICPFTADVNWNEIILDNDAMKEIYTAPELKVLEHR